jgi:hypothetical protein
MCLSLLEVSSPCLGVLFLHAVAAARYPFTSIVCAAQFASCLSWLSTAWGVLACRALGRSMNSARICVHACSLVRYWCEWLGVPLCLWWFVCLNSTQCACVLWSRSSDSAADQCSAATWFLGVYASVASQLCSSTLLDMHTLCWCAQSRRWCVHTRALRSTPVSQVQHMGLLVAWRVWCVLRRCVCVGRAAQCAQAPSSYAAHASFCAADAVCNVSQDSVLMC